MKAHHTLVVGDSGTGKSTLLRQIHGEFRGYSIWYDHTQRDAPDGRAGPDYVTVNSPRELAKASGRRIRVRCRDAKRALRDSREHLQGVYERTGWPVQVIIDEAQVVMPDGEDSASGNPLATMLHQDRDRAIKCVLASQDPSDLEYGPLKQCKNIAWVGPASPFHEGFVRYFRVPADRLPSRPYRYVVFQSAGLDWSVAYSGETDPSY